MFLSSLLVSLFTFVELNCENLFDCQHDSLKHDTEFLSDGAYRWTPYRYWRKLNRVGQTIVACGDNAIPDMVALCEVENDSVMFDLTRRSLLRTARYEYVMTDSPDERGIDVALMYAPYSFRLLGNRSVRVKPVRGMSPTRDILYASGIIATGDTLHVVVAHLPSRRGGEQHSRPFRQVVAEAIGQITDSVRALSPNAKIVVAGDFNDYSTSPSIVMLSEKSLTDISSEATGANGARATYKYKGEWRSIDHILVSQSLLPMVVNCRVGDARFLLKRDRKYGGVEPHRNYLGPRWLDGFSDHLPLVAEFTF